MSKYTEEQLNRKKIMNKLIKVTEKINDNKYWNIIINKDVVLNNCNYSCVFYVLIHYEIFDTHLCSNFNCYFCHQKSTNVIFDYCDRAKIINNILNYYPLQFISLNELILEFLIHLQIKFMLFNFTCPCCKKRDYPLYKNIKISENNIIDSAYKIRKNINTKWKKHKVIITGKEILHC